MFMLTILSSFLLSTIKMIFLIGMMVLGVLAGKKVREAKEKKEIKKESDDI